MNAPVVSKPAPVVASKAVATASVDPTKKTAVAPTAAVQKQAFMIEELDDEDVVQYVNMLIYGKFGCGKTTLAATAADVPDMADVLMLDFESGKMTLKDNDRIENKRGIDTVRITNFRQLAKVHEFLKAHCRFRDDPAREAELAKQEAMFKGTTPDKITKPRHYRTVIIDSLSELDTLCLYELLGVQTDADLEKIMDSGDKNGPDVAEFKEYKQNNQMMLLVVRAYRDLPINVILVCHEKFDQDEQKRMLYSPTLTGKLSKQVQGFVDIVGYMQVGSLPPVDAKGNQPEAPRRLWLQPAGKFDAKCRIASFKAPFIDNPYMEDIWDAMNG